MSSLEKKIKEIGYTLGNIPKSLAAYVPAKKIGEFIFVSGQLPLENNKLIMEGPIHSESQIPQAKLAMELCFLNGLSCASHLIGIDNIKEVIRLGAFVSSSPNFHSHHLVADGASEIAHRLFEDKGKHTRFAIGVNSLPKNASVELELLFHS